MASFDSDSDSPQRTQRKRALRKKNLSNDKTPWEELPQEPFSTESDSDTSSEKELSESSHQPTNKLSNLKFSKESLEYFRDNTIYFISPEGKPLDQGGERLFNKHLVEQRPSYTPQTIKIDKVGKRHYFWIMFSRK